MRRNALFLVAVLAAAGLIWFGPYLFFAAVCSFTLCDF